MELYMLSDIIWNGVKQSTKERMRTPGEGGEMPSDTGAIACEVSAKRFDTSELTLGVSRSKKWSTSVSFIKIRDFIMGQKSSGEDSFNGTRSPTRARRRAGMLGKRSRGSR
ncbi:hypothetical protein Enr17x_45910 [Gimesia fumaroli]|uniref:Uncharacterized protein n=1 Tax=Gimesia fumaroli TaxID=2527976 RepID=A0A518IHG3_9PLAN|nr:hypothetical protein Enr17x_45910 [Gimesia fumaroli]